ncbi:sigma-70 family RNA polymerase sigma factor [Paraburkholderia sp.]|uniref:sigma-70 family RNA polymerase sigma factor n=1 Tax=Paraburkholderia sp. TaxID=1926495 RepID=UPI002384D817|nr:sigma-70 family RNA polymerase sigma factor [Paraburkholderia sp.]MDE1183105.1 sigma-70 family RNA polymerase sigma factor [Paraburkholderia sp.]
MTDHSFDLPTFDAIRARLFALAYRMLGSRAEAEDVVQDVWLKWLLTDRREIRTPAAWLTTSATHAAIDRLRHAQRERAAGGIGWMTEPWIDGVAPSAEDLALRAADLSYGVMLMLERLKPAERAAFVLHEAFDCDYAEIAKILDRTPAGCRQLVHRAKARLQRHDAHRHDTQVAAPERVDPATHARVVERLRAALDAQDRAEVLRLVADAPLVTDDKVVASAIVGTGLSEKWAVAASRTRTLGFALRIGYAQTVSIDGAPCIALLRDGEIVGLIDVSVGMSGADACPAIVALRIVTHAAQLEAVNRAFGRTAILHLLDRAMRRNTAAAHERTSTAMRRDFPVDIDA